MFPMYIPKRSVIWTTTLVDNLCDNHHLQRKSMHLHENQNN